MKSKYLILIAIVATIAAGCKKDEPLSETQQKDKIEDVGIELLDYADVSNWGDAFAAFAKFEKAVSDRNNDQSALEDLENGIETTEETGEEDIYMNYGWYCNYQKPGTFTNERSTTVQLANVKGLFTLNADKKAWVKQDAPSLTVKATVDGEEMAANVTIATDATRSLLDENRDETYNEWPAYTTGPAMYFNVTHYDDPYGGYDSWETVTRNEGRGVEYHFYNPITNAEIGWYSDDDIYSDYNAFNNMISVPAGRHADVKVRKSFIYVPKTITAGFSKAGNKIADVNVGIDYRPAVAGQLNLADDQADVEFSFSASGYTLKSKKVNYLSDGAQASYTFSKGKKTILTMSASEKGFKLASKPHVNKQDYDNGDGYKNGYNYSSTSYDISTMPKSAEISVNILDEIRINGSVNVEKVVEISKQMDSLRTNENEFKKLIADAEKEIKVQVFYDKSKKSSAHFGLEPEKKDNGSWDVIPVIRFDDGSAYALFSDFFNETDFADLIKAIEEWQKSVDEYISSVLNKKESN